MSGIARLVKLLHLSNTGFEILRSSGSTWNSREYLQIPAYPSQRAIATCSGSCSITPAGGDPPTSIVRISCQRAYQMGYPKACLLQAQALDRHLMSRNRPHRYGIQYKWNRGRQKFILWPVDEVIDDAERLRLNLARKLDLPIEIPMSDLQHGDLAHDPVSRTW